MDEDDPWLRQPWEDADPPPRQTSGRPAAGTEALLIPLARAQDAVARHGGGEIELGYLDCVAEAAMRGARELDRLLAAVRRIAELPGSARSRLPAAAPSPCRSRWSPDACSPVGSMFRRTPVWRAFAIA